MVTDLVDHDVRYDLFEAEGGGLPFGNDGSSIENDPLGQRSRHAYALAVERDALVQPAELHRISKAEASSRIWIGDFLHLEHYVAETVAERRRKTGKSAPRDCIDVMSGRSSA